MPSTIYQTKHHAVKPPPLSKEEETIAKNTIVDLPLCMIEEIISRVSIDDLLKWKFVSKPWNDLLSSPEFARIHQNRFKQISMAIMDYCRNSSYPTSDRLAGNKIYYLPKILPRGKMEIVGSCDGLICLMNRGNRNIVILNPLTRDYWRLGAAESCSDWSHSWFGHHPSTGDYTLFLGSTCFSYLFNFVTQIENWNINNDDCYQSSRDFIWVDQIKHLDRGKYTISEEIGILLHEILHWPASIERCDNRYYQTVNKVITYDFNKNEVSEIAVRCSGYNSCFTLGVLYGCLFGIFKFGFYFELWVMKAYGVKESWTKYRNILGYGYFDKLTPLGFCSDGEMIMDDDRSELTKCNLISDGKSELPKCILISGYGTVCADCSLIINEKMDTAISR
ncbi:hypothetical protein DH2020_005096 [Rehmannia glutinosa]|uniref:F-box domain-containing protein n=1 Tax=Rehmannia glutinosa TaxID=99300 RepID=A0ABR0XRM9_REHGL